MSALAVPSALSATDFFVTPEGAGDKSGSTWENAMGLTEFYSHMKFVFNSTPVNDYHTGENFYFATGNYTFTQTVFFYRSSVNLKGGYDPATGELATEGRTVFDGNNQSRKNGALYICCDDVRVTEADKKRPVSISKIDFENFVTNGEWRGNETNWQSGRPSAIYIFDCERAEISDCNFRNNKCVGTGANAMAGAVSLNRVIALVRNCSFVGNEGTNGGAVKLYYNSDAKPYINCYLTADGCYFAENKTSDTGGAILGRNTFQVNILNSTITNNEANTGGGVWVNSPTNDYPNVCNIVSSTIGGNTATDVGPEVYTNGTGVLNVTNSIIVNGADGFAVADASATTSYKFLGNNYIGKVAEGYTSAESNNISENNTYASIFGDNVAKDGTLRPIKFVEGMNPDEISTIVTGENWPYTVDVAVDQLGNARSAMTTAGALAVNKDSITTGGVDSLISDEETEGDESWYTLMGVRLTDRPTVSGLYIHKGRKVMIR